MVIEEGTPRSWPERVRVFTATIAAVGAVVGEIEEPHRPGLGEWDTGELAWHTHRAVTTLQRYLEAAHSGVPDLLDAAAYFAAYLQRRSADPEALDRAVADRARSNDVRSMAELSAAFDEAVVWSRTTLLTSHSDLILQTPFGGITLDAYLSTRLLELVVHGMDLADAVGTDIDVPQAALDDTCTLLMQVASRRNRQADVIQALTGRISTVPPLLQ